MTPLLWAAWFGHVDVLQQLINNGANVHATNLVRHAALLCCITLFILSLDWQLVSCEYLTAAIDSVADPFSQPQVRDVLRLSNGVGTIFTRDSIAGSAYMLRQFRLSVRPSVCLSVRPSHGWISQKRLKLGSYNFHHTVAPSL